MTPATPRTITVEALDADRLTAIIESRMSHDLAWLRDDGKTVDRFGPEQVAWALAHLYQTGDVVSGLPALPAEPAGEDPAVTIQRRTAAMEHYESRLMAAEPAGAGLREALKELAYDLVNDHRGIPYDVIDRIDALAATPEEA